VLKGERGSDSETVTSGQTFLIHFNSGFVSRSSFSHIFSARGGEKMRVTRSLKFLLLSLAVFSVVIPSLPYFVAPVHAEEPTLATILSNLGFENTILTDVETFSAGTYNITLYAEFAGWHDINELSYYELNASDVFNVIFYGSDGGSGYVVPPVNKSFTADYEFGLSMFSQYNRRYFTQNSRNGDGKIHSVVYENLDDTGMYLIGFENTWGGGDQDYNDMVFSLELYTPPVNTPSSISGLPDLELDEDTSLDNVIDLWNYASDAETLDENLIFTILSITEPDVGVSIDSNRYIDVQPTANWYGISEVTVEISDGELTDTDSFTITVNSVNDPPVASNLAISPSGPDTTDDLVGSYDYYDLEGDLENGTEIRWYKDSVLQLVYNDLLTIPSSATAKGETWYFTVKPKDGMDFGDLQTSPTVVIGNTPPEASNLAISPSSPYTTDDLVASYTYYDADIDPESGSEIRWYKNAVMQPAFNDLLTVPSSVTAKGQVWNFTVKPKDGTSFGALQTSPSVTIQNSPPTAPVVDVTPDFPLTTDDLTCTVVVPSTDPDGDTITYTYECYKDDVLQPSLTTVTTALSVTIDSSNTAEGEVWRCVVTPNDGTEDGPTDQDEVMIGMIPNSPPVLDTIGNKIVDEETLLSFTATATDPNVPPQTLTFSLGPGAPLGASITSGGYFTWTPTEAQGPGTYPIRIVVSDGTAEDYEDITVIVNEVNVAPVLAPIGAKTVSEGALLQFTVTASDSDIPAQTLTYSASSLPLGATFNPGTHVFSWTPASGQAGVYYNLHFEVSDGDLKDSEDITITVTSGAPPPPAVGGYALPITLDLGTSNSLIPQIGLASALSVAVAATIILVGRRKKTLRREH